MNIGANNYNLDNYNLKEPVLKPLNTVIKESSNVSKITVPKTLTYKSEYEQFIDFKNKISQFTQPISITETVSNAIANNINGLSEISNISKTCSTITSSLTLPLRTLEVKAILDDTKLTPKQKKEKLGGLVGQIVVSTAVGGIGFKTGKYVGSVYGSAVGNALGGVGSKLSSMLGTAGGIIGAIGGAIIFSHYSSKIGKWIGEKFGSLLELHK